MAPSFARGRTAAAVAGAVVGSIISTAVPTQLKVGDVDATGFLPVAVATAVSLAAVKHWLKQHEERTKADVRTLAEQHQQRSWELDRRERSVVARELAVARREDTQTIRLATLVRNLDTAHSRIAAQTAAHETLTAAYDEVRGDYNALIEHCLRTGHDRFTAHVQGALGPLPAVETRGGDDEHRRGPTPPPVTYLRPRAHHPSA